MDPKDILGRNLTPTEAELAKAYDQLKSLAQRPDLAPCARAAVQDAVAALWNAVNDLQLRFEAEA